MINYKQYNNISTRRLQRMKFGLKAKTIKNKDEQLKLLIIEQQLDLRKHSA